MKQRYQGLVTNPCGTLYKNSTNGTSPNGTDDEDQIFRHLWLDENDLHGTLPLELFYFLPHLESLSLPDNSYNGAGFQAWREEHPGVDPHKTYSSRATGTQALIEEYPQLAEKFNPAGILDGFFLLSENQQLGFNQSLPTEIGLLTALTRLQLVGNRLTGSLPTEIGRLTNLKCLHFKF